MSWQQRIENIQFTITTGDGQVFTPLWQFGSKSVQYNVSSFSFIDVPGEFVDRKRPQANKYPLEFWFQGDDVIDQADAFQLAAADPRPWTIKHPFYGNITGQPISLNRDDTSYNVTRIAVDFWETITEDYPNPQTSINDAIIAGAAETTENSSAGYISRIDPEPEDGQIMQDNIIQIAADFNGLFDNDNFAQYQNARETALNAASNLISDPITAINSTHLLLTIPASFEKPVKNRIDAYVSAFESMKDVFQESSSVSTKLYFESQAAVLIASMCDATARPQDGDYVTRTEIEAITSIIAGAYDEYLQILDDNQVPLSDVENAYHGDSVTLDALAQTVSQTAGQLFALAFEAKQERTFEVDRDTNIILLTHRFLGLDPDDANIERFRQINNIKNNELLRIRKGRQIKYFV